MARYCSLFSGSSGNSTYIASGECGLLVDAGVSAKRLTEALSARNIDPARIAGVLVTHEHSDHIAGLRVLVKRFGIPVYATAGTLSFLCEQGAVPPSADLHELSPDMTAAEVGGLQIEAFRTPHDAADSCGFRITLPDGRRVGVATDMGSMWPSVRQALATCDLIHIESNHDVRMLETGGYPYHLKQRILGERGHLSNAACAAELPALVQNGVTRITLAHLSRENNAPYLAEVVANAALQTAGFREGIDYTLRVAAPESADGVTVF